MIQPVVPALRRLRLREYKLEANLGNTGRDPVSIHQPHDLKIVHNGHFMCVGFHHVALQETHTSVWQVHEVPGLRGRDGSTPHCHPDNLLLRLCPHCPASTLWSWTMWGLLLLAPLPAPSAVFLSPKAADSYWAGRADKRNKRFNDYLAD